MGIGTRRRPLAVQAEMGGGNRYNSEVRKPHLHGEVPLILANLSKVELTALLDESVNVWRPDFSKQSGNSGQLNTIEIFRH